MSYKQACLLLLLASLVGLGIMPVSAQIDKDDLLLVWTAPVSDPSKASNNLGDLGFVQGKGKIETFIAVPTGTNRIQPCGQQPLSPDGRNFVFYMGNDSSRQGGNLYIITDGRPPQQIATVQSLTCIGANGRFAFSPNSERFAYIAYTPESLQARYASGDLKVRRSEDYNVLLSVETGKVVSFDLTDSGVAFINFITDEQGNAKEASVNWWDGNNTRELMTLRTTGSCRYISGMIRATSTAYWVSLGESCNGNELQIYRIDLDGEQAVVAVQTQPSGGLFTSSETNNLIFSTDGKTMFYTVPSGLDQNTVRLVQMPLNDFRATKTIIDQHAKMPTIRANLDAEPVVSPNGNWIAFVTSDGTRRYIQVINLGDPSQDPISIQATNGSGEIVPFLAFTPDSRFAVYVAGREGLHDDNYMSRIDLGKGTSERIIDGAFTGWGQMSPHDDKVAILEWQPRPADHPSLSNYLDLVLVDVSEGKQETLYEGVVVDGDKASTRFALPLSWFTK